MLYYLCSALSLGWVAPIAPISMSMRSFSPVYISHAGLQPLLPLSLHLRAGGGCRSAGVGVEGGLGWGPTTFHGSEF